VRGGAVAGIGPQLDAVLAEVARPALAEGTVARAERADRAFALDPQIHYRWSSIVTVHLLLGLAVVLLARSRRTAKQNREVRARMDADDL